MDPHCVFRRDLEVAVRADLRRHRCSPAAIRAVGCTSDRTIPCSETDSHRRVHRGCRPALCLPGRDSIPSSPTSPMWAVQDPSIPRATAIRIGTTSPLRVRRIRSQTGRGRVALPAQTRADGTPDPASPRSIQSHKGVPSLTVTRLHVSSFSSIVCEGLPSIESTQLYESTSGM